MSFAIGVTGGFFGSLIGLGGGLIIIPLMTKYLCLSQRQAHGTSLVALVFTGIFGSVPYLWYHHTDLPSALTLALFAMVTAHLGAHYCHKLSEFRLKRYFGIFLIGMAFLIMVKPYLHPLSHPIEGLFKWMTLGGVGLMVGFLSGLMGIGGGALLITSLVLLLGYNQHLAQGTSLFAMIPGSAVGGWTHWKNGLVVTDHLGGLVGGIIGGAFLGALLAQHMPGSVLRIVFAIILTALGYRYIKSSLSKEKRCNEYTQCGF
ncbi:MAG: sulfite exporter TauE/SafE family protein [Syntrophales bacterium]|nr:sulfite exporter TauE/SafE family protein [Syntrophales bacterium]